MTCTDPEFIDLGFNGEIEDKCDYLDYFDIDSDTDHDCDSTEYQRPTKQTSWAE